MRFYMYDFGDLNVYIKWDYDRFFYKRWCEESFNALHRHPYRVDDPEEADFFIVTQTLRSVPFAGFSWRAYLDGFLRGQKFWNQGKPHVFFDIKDSPRPIIEDPRAIVCKTAFHEDFFNPKLHIPIPQFPRERFEEEIIPVGERKHLVGFKGHPRTEWTDLRSRLFKLNDGKDIIIVPGIYSKDTIEEHNNILRNSKFALLPRANGYALSYRMIECMNLGCIPVIISDGHVLPFQSEIDYNSFSVRIKENKINNLEEMLRNREDLEILQRKSYGAYLKYFSSTETIINHSLNLIEKMEWA
tara:strand:- start:4798 stop:5697 length:900 start_codon:yes stop_codon:yes gene_type:complete